MSATQDEPGAGPLFDAHLHIVDPAHPLQANDGFVPDAFDVDAYRAASEPLGVVAGAVVSGSFQGFDQGYLRAALRRLGPTFVGVTQLPPTVADDEIRQLHDDGVRAVRFNLVRGGSAGLADLELLARRVFDLVGWHAELYVDGRDLADLEPRLAALPRVSIDHLGMHADGLPSLLRLVAAGVKVKATGFGRVDLDVADAVARIAAVDERALLFGTDLPSTRARRPFRADDVELLRGALPASAVRAALYVNAAAWYGLGVDGRAS